MNYKDLANLITLTMLFAAFFFYIESLRAEDEAPPTTWLDTEIEPVDPYNGESDDTGLYIGVGRDITIAPDGGLIIGVGSGLGIETE